MMPGERLDAALGQLQSGTVGGRLAGSRDRPAPQQGTRYDPPAFELSDVLGDATPQQVDPNGAGSAGVGVLGAREDHVHGLPLSTLDPVAVDISPASPGATGEVADAGHGHPFDPQNAGIPPWSVNADPDTLVLRNPDGAAAVGTATLGPHAVPLSQANATYATAVALANHAAETAAHSATAAATANRIVLRDAAGRTQVAAPAAAADVARKQEVDTVQADVDAHEALTGNTSVHGAAFGPTPSTLVRRSTGARAQFANPVDAADAATKASSEAVVAAHAALGGGDAVHGAAAVLNFTGNRTVVARDVNGRAEFAYPATQYQAAPKGYVDERQPVATFLVAADDSRTLNKNAADFVATAANSNTAVQAALTAIDVGTK